MNTEPRKFEIEEVTEVPTPPRAKVEDAVEEPAPLVTSGLSGGESGTPAAGQELCQT